MRSEYAANLALQRPPQLPAWQQPAPKRASKARKPFFARIVAFFTIH